jgi:hypothetical protein|tara:strand:- start:1982 stop:2272 length:291 start_codon:yes stop_codon:yes gene_type:complete
VKELYYIINLSKKIIDSNPLMSGDCSNIYGHCNGLYGDVSNLYGDITTLKGDATGLWGDATGVELCAGFNYQLIGDVASYDKTDWLTSQIPLREIT